MRHNFNPHTVIGDITHIQIKDQTVVINTVDLELVGHYRWHMCNGYAATDIRTNGTSKKLSLHRLLMGCPDQFVDHADLDPLNNTRGNLRLATRSQNQTNQGIRSDNTSDFRGVNWHNQSKKWRTSINHQGRHYYLGLFSTREAAHEAYKLKAEELNGSFASTPSRRLDATNL